VKHKLTAAHEKELNRLTSKLTKSDLSLESSVAEIRTLKDTIRMLQLSLTKSTTSLAKHTASLPLLQSQLTTLTTSHATSRARKDAELVALKDDHAAQLSTQDATISSLESSLASAESTTAAILSTSQSTISSLTSITSSLSTTHTTSLANLFSSLATAQSQILSLSRQISERTSQVSELVSYSQSLEEELALLSQSHDDLTDELSWRARECKWERETGVRSEKEWRQRARSDGRELVSLRAEVEGWVMGRDIERSVELCEREEGERRIEEVRREVEALEDELEVAEGNELWASEVEIPRLEACVGQLEGELEEALESEERTREELVEMGERKARVEGENREREGELEEMRRRVSDLEGEWERERSERLRVEKALGYSRIAEMGLREEVDAYVPVTSFVVVPH
jgi:chromosome segregation ATPase